MWKLYIKCFSNQLLKGNYHSIRYISFRFNFKWKDFKKYCSVMWQLSTVDHSLPLTFRSLCSPSTLQTVTFMSLLQTVHAWLSMSGFLKAPSQGCFSAHFHTLPRQSQSLLWYLTIQLVSLYLQAIPLLWADYVFICIQYLKGPRLKIARVETTIIPHSSRCTSQKPKCHSWLFPTDSSLPTPINCTF